MFQMHKDRLEKISKPVKNDDEDLPNGSTESSEDDVNRSKILDSLGEFQKNDIIINYVSDTVFCKKCLKDLEQNYDVIKGHIEDHKKKANKKEIKKIPFVPNQNKASGNTLITKPVLLKRNESVEPQSSRRSTSSVSCKDAYEIEEFANKNNMHFRDNKVYCNVCGTYLPPSLKTLKQHVEGANHKYKLIKIDTVVVKKRELIKLPMSGYAKSILSAEDNFSQDIVINENICINIQSFQFLKYMTRLAWKCYACDVTFATEALETHKRSDRHITAMGEAPAVVLESEFIREVRLDIYHCGYSNIIESGWASMN